MQKILLTPGPINVSFNVKKETLIDYGSRDSMFLEKVGSVKEKLISLFNLDNNVKIVLLQGSGTYGVEAVIQQLKGKTLLLINGAYGVRMETIFSYSGKEYLSMTFEEGQEIHYDEVDKLLENDNSIKNIAFVHLETSTGVLNNIDKLKNIAKKYDKKLVADCIASFGSDHFDFNDVDYLITSCNKCLQGIPGFVIVIAKSFNESATYCLDLNSQNEYYDKTKQFRFTPPTHVLIAFVKALEELEIETLSNRIIRFKTAKKLIHDKLEDLGILPFVSSEYATGNICHTFVSPSDPNYNFDKLYNELAKYNFLMYPGKLTKTNSFRIGSIGDYSLYDIEIFLSYFKFVYTSMIKNKKIDPIDPVNMYDYLEDNNVSFYAGVPDSLLQDFNNCVLEKSKNHYTTPNEGIALTMATGYYVATKKIPVVYLQNSGIGNIINPLMSLAHGNVYSIPMLIIIGWRGEPNIHDEPQHVSQGECMLNLINVMGFEYVYLDKLCWKKSIDKALHKISISKKPVFLVVSKGLFKKYNLNVIANQYPLIRRDVLKTIAVASNEKDILCCTTGKSSRELDEICSENNINKSRTFLMVGSMGYISSFSIALSIYGPTDNKIWCLDGDGSMLMHLGNVPMIGQLKQKNYIHILMNNGMHESVGCTPTISHQLDLNKIAESAGYERCFTITTEADLLSLLNLIHSELVSPLTFINILMSNLPSTGELSRPTTTPKQRVVSLINYLNPSQ